MHSMLEIKYSFFSLKYHSIKTCVIRFSCVKYIYWLSYKFLLVWHEADVQKISLYYTILFKLSFYHEHWEFGLLYTHGCNKIPVHTRNCSQTLYMTTGITVTAVFLCDYNLYVFYIIYYVFICSLFSYSINVHHLYIILLYSSSSFSSFLH